MKPRILIAALIACMLSIPALSETTTNATITALLTRPKSEVSGALGTRTNPVRCDQPSGERAYLRRLRDANGNAPTFYRVGSYGHGPHGFILDGYEVTSGTNKVMVFMDMYHPRFIETNTVPGFTIINK